MDADRTFDRRSFLRRAGAVSLFGLSGLREGGLGDGRGSDGATGRTGRTDAERDGARRDDARQDGGIDFFRAVVPTGTILETKLVNKILVVGSPIQPGVRPPPLCFPEGVDQWYARDTLVVKPTETTGLFEEDEKIGAVNRTRAHLERPVESSTVYRITGGEYCDGHASVRVHELPPRLSEYFSKEMLDRLGRILDEGGNRTAGNEITGAERITSERGTE